MAKGSKLSHYVPRGLTRFSRAVLCGSQIYVISRGCMYAFSPKQHIHTCQLFTHIVAHFRYMYPSRRSLGLGSGLDDARTWVVSIYVRVQRRKRLRRMDVTINATNYMEARVTRVY